MNKQKSIEVLQFFATGLSAGAYAHKVQGQIFKSLGFSKLGQKYAEHYTEEMEWVEKFIDRILDLGGEIKIEATEATPLIHKPIEYLHADLARQEKGVKLLYECMEAVRQDPTTYDILKTYLADEEEDLYWSQEQVDMIEMIGVQNWLVTQL